MYGFGKAYPNAKELGKFLMERSTQMLNEECIGSLLGLETAQQELILDFVKFCTVRVGEMTGLCKQAVYSLKRTSTITKLTFFQ